MLSNIINFCNTRKKDLFLAVIIILTAFIGFGLGRLSKIRENKMPITITNAECSGTNAENRGANAKISAENLTSGVANSASSASSQQPSASLVASKNGTKYHYPWCPGAVTIKEENKIYFATPEEARKAGYTPASNCKGLK